MSYQVLARKWRPKTFHEMAGQTHVLRALENALAQGRLHHAYLFTGTRGVGKTTVARILAKCLNCETGISATPCGTCTTCIEIDQGRSVDLIEVDAASRTRVEDTRELLDNVQYAPTRARFKIYLIDEVHMLSTHSFNALLKTLEEPPEHVKFLLATTDPQKLPITVLSRCLQFSLKNMSPQRIVAHLETILPQEQIEFDAAALWEIANAADGSMRDALSLTDQAIAFGNGKLTATDVQSMLGTIDRQRILQLAQAIFQQNLSEALNRVSELAEQGSDLQQVLADLLLILHRVALAQLLPQTIDNALGDKASIIELAQLTTPQVVQLYYQTALMGRRDLTLVPDLKSGLEMVVMRMMMFVPFSALDNLPLQAEVTPQAQQALEPEQQKKNRKSSSAEGRAIDSSTNSTPNNAAQTTLGQPGTPGNGVLHANLAVSESVLTTPPQENPSSVSCPPRQQSSDTALEKTVLEKYTISQGACLEEWSNIIQNLGAEGIAYHLAQNSTLMQLDQAQVVIKISPDSAPMRTQSAEKRLEMLLQQYLQQPVRLVVEVGELETETPSQRAIRLKQARLAAAADALNHEPLAVTLMETFGARLNKGSLELVD